MSSSSDFCTASWAALTAWFVIPRLEQKRLCSEKIKLIRWFKLAHHNQCEDQKIISIPKVEETKIQESRGEFGT